MPVVGGPRQQPWCSEGRCGHRIDAGPRKLWLPTAREGTNRNRDRQELDVSRRHWFRASRCGDDPFGQHWPSRI